MKDFPSERRLYTRMSKRLPVSIYYDGLSISQCYTCNISIGGVMLEVQDLGLIKNALVEIRFHVSSWHALNGVKIPAIAAWHDDKHIAVSFETLCKDAEELMRDPIDSEILHHNTCQ